MKPTGAPIVHSAARAATVPYGNAANTINGLIAFLDWRIGISNTRAPAASIV